MKGQCRWDLRFVWHLELRPAQAGETASRWTRTAPGLVAQLGRDVAQVFDWTKVDWSKIFQNHGWGATTDWSKIDWSKIYGGLPAAPSPPPFGVAPPGMSYSALVLEA